MVQRSNHVIKYAHNIPVISFVILLDFIAFVMGIQLVMFRMSYASCRC